MTRFWNNEVEKEMSSVISAIELHLYRTYAVGNEQLN